MTNPFIPAQPQPAQPQLQNPYVQPQPSFQQGAATYGTPQPQYAPQTQYSGSPAGNGLVAQPGQFVPIGAPPADAVTGQPPIKSLAGGRLLLIMPTKIEHGLPGKPRAIPGAPPGTPPEPAKPYSRMTATIVVLDGGPLTWGGEAINDPRKTEQVPYVIRDKYITQTKLISQLSGALAMREQGGPGLSIGRLWKTSAEMNAPYVLQEPSAQDIEIYNQYVAHTNPFAL